jgi:hypothetical protein
MRELLSFPEILVDDSPLAIKVENPILSGLDLFLAVHGAGRSTPSVWCVAILIHSRSTLNRLNQVRLLQQFSGRILPPLAESAVVDAMIGTSLFMLAFSVMFEMIVEFIERSSLNSPGSLSHARMYGLEEDYEPTCSCVTSSTREVKEMKNVTSVRLSSPSRSMPCRLRYRQ